MQSGLSIPTFDGLGVERQPLADCPSVTDGPRVQVCVSGQELPGAAGCPGIESVRE